MMNKKASVAKWVALAVVPLSLAAVLASVVQQHRARRAEQFARQAEVATRQLLRRFSYPRVSKNIPVSDFIAQGADVNARDKNGEPVLYLAVFFSDEPTGVKDMQTLLDHGADVNARDDFGRSLTALYLAVLQGKSKAARLLLSRGANVNDTMYMSPKRPVGYKLKPSETTALRLAQEYARDHQGASDPRAKDYAEIVRLLKAAGARE